MLGTAPGAKEWVESITAAVMDAKVEQVRECVHHERPLGSSA
jgi:hypothetical protein